MRPDVDLISLRFGRDRGKMPPLGPLYLGAALQDAGLSWRLTDMQLDSTINAFSVDPFAGILRRLDAPVIGLSLFNDALPLVMAALDELGDRLQGRRLIVGGPGVVGTASKLLQRLPQVEAVVVGEGESALPRLIRQPTEAALFPGVFTRDSDGRVVGQGQTSREHLDHLPSPQWQWCRRWR